MKNMPAFPQCVAIGPAGDVVQSWQFPDGAGMTYRQWLVGQLAPPIAVDTDLGRSMRDVPDDQKLSLFARTTIAMADALIAELEKSDG